MENGIGPDEAATLVAAASRAAAWAYAPYSAFHVGAALLADSGRVYAGCNVENASYGLSICAERAAVSAAVSAGEHAFRAVAVVGHRAVRVPAPADHGPAAITGGECLPCGACRQVLTEFCHDDMPVLTEDAAGAIRWRRLGDLLPEAFRLPGPVPGKPG